jgi:hypothetical protein
LFSTTGMKAKIDGMPTDLKQIAGCRILRDEVAVGYGYAFASQRDGEPGLELVFNYLENQGFLFRSSVFFDQILLAKLLKPSQEEKRQNQLDVDTYDPLTSKMTLSLILKADQPKVILRVTQGNKGKTEDLKLNCNRLAEGSPHTNE